MILAFLALAFFGVHKVECVPAPGSPVACIKAGLLDPAGQKGLPDGTDGINAMNAAGQMRYWIEVRNDGPREVSGYEMRWSSLNAMREATESVLLSYAPNQAATENQSFNAVIVARRVGDAAASYSVEITRVRFADGTVWP